MAVRPSRCASCAESIGPSVFSSFAMARRVFRSPGAWAPALMSTISKEFSLQSQCPVLTFGLSKGLSLESGFVMTSDSFSGLRVAITGGTSGLGLALVRELVTRGARVAFVARTRERVEQVMHENPGAHGIVGDVSVKSDIYPIAI